MTINVISLLVSPIGVELSFHHYYCVLRPFDIEQFFSSLLSHFNRVKPTVACGEEKWPDSPLTLTKASHSMTVNKKWVIISKYLYIASLYI